MTGDNFGLPSPPATIHFVGIGGIGMSGLARLLQSAGYRVTGSDRAGSELTVHLQREGIEVEVGPSLERQVREAQVVIRTAAVLESNQAIAIALAVGIPVLKRSELLGGLAATRKCLGIAGTHGKSTTSAMLVSALIALGLEPSYAIGAVLHSTEANAAFGSGPYFVVEADEYDRSFLTLKPWRSIVTTIEYDHPDIFESEEVYDDAFLQFAQKTRSDGFMILRHDDAGSRRLLDQLPASLRGRSVTFGDAVGADWRVLANDDHWIVVDREGFPREMHLRVPGLHNALNALAVIATLSTMEIGADEAIAAVGTYGGIGRRFEVKGTAAGVTIVDDYAHHPTEIAATIAAATRRFPDRRIWYVFQPHTFTRTASLRDAFAKAMALAEHRMVLDVYGAREQDDGRVSEADLRLIAGRDGIRASDVYDASAQLLEVVKSGDVVLTMGAGDVTSLCPMLLAALGSPSPHPSKAL
ncbi:UDP-N-acetylmuramate--L-alanine ligase [soil metagenome]